MTCSRAFLRYRILFAVALLLPLFFPAPVAAAGETSTLTLECYKRLSDDEIDPMAGDRFLIYRIADGSLDMTGGEPALTYQAVDPFPAEAAGWHTLQDNERKAKALELAALVDAESVEPAYDEMVTGADGTGTISGITPGFYLCVREESSPSFDDYLMNPFLFESIQLVNGDVSYHLVGVPKYVARPDDSSRPDPGPGPDPDPGGRDPGPGRDGPRYGGATRLPPPSPGDPGQSAVTVEPPTTPLVQLPPGSTPLEQKPLPQTGQLRWPIPILIVAGVMLFITGFDLRYGERRQDEEK